MLYMGRIIFVNGGGYISDTLTPFIQVSYPGVVLAAHRNHIFGLGQEILTQGHTFKCLSGDVKKQAKTQFK